MKKIILLSLALFLSASASAKPRLLVVVSVDQMRADYFNRDFTAGLKRLKNEGARFTDARHDHIPTETGPGHAVILTGQRPGRTGIVGNTWFDRALSTNVYVVGDSVHKLGPEHLLAYTLGDALKAFDSASRVVSVSAKDRAAILMGGKKPDVAIWYDRKTGYFTTSSYYATPGWLDAFNTRVKSGDGPLAALKNKADYDDFVYYSSADAAVLLLARESIGQFGLGGDEHTDILAVGFSATDYVGHRHGYEGPAMTAHLKKLDGFIAELLAAAEKAAGKGNFDLVLTADHGVTPLPEAPLGKAKKIERVMFDVLGLDFEKLLQDAFPAKKPWVVNQYPNVYLNEENLAATGLKRPEFLRKAAAALEKDEDVAKIYIPEELDPADPFYEVYRRSIMPGRSGDLVVRVKEGVLITDRPTGTDHGTPYEDDRHVPLVFWGPDFKGGTYDAPTPVVDLAPTCAALLGVKLPAAEGKAHSEILK